jgi:arylsulfatase A-like enzyme
VHAGRQGRWFDVSVELPGRGEARLELRADHVYKSGEAYPTDPEDHRPWIRIAEPRVYARRPPEERRVLVWISQDTVRADHLASYGYERETTPAFDRLSRRWTVFERAIAPASWTLPSMASQFTSRYPSFHGVGIRERPERQYVSLFEALAGAGFTTLGATGNPLLSGDFDFTRGFDAYWLVEDGAAELNRVVLKHLDETEGGDVALFLHYMDPHFPYDPPPPFDARFAAGYEGPADGRNFESFGPEDLDDVAHVRALYDGDLAWTDAQIGALLAELGKRGLLENALLVYSADHGEEFLDHGGWTHSRTLYSEVLHVPFAVRVPGVPPARAVKHVSLVDLAPTVLEHFGIEVPASFQGRSLLPLIRGGDLPPRPIFAETRQNADGQHRVAVQDGRLKYVLVTPPGEEPRVLSEELFDVEADPGEVSPLDAGAAERLRRIAFEFLKSARAEASAAREREIAPEIEERLRALGYIGER